jgi:hypothetical protein
MPWRKKASGMNTNSGSALPEKLAVPASGFRQKILHMRFAGNRFL